MNTKNEWLEYDVLEYGPWQLCIAKTEKGLCYVGSPEQSDEEFKIWAKKRFPFAEIKQNKKTLKPYIDELISCFQGTRQAFSQPIDAKGTLFQEQVWEALKQIPYGQTRSYSEVAAFIQKPLAVRAVGSAIGANPVLIALPCHRVIGKNGALAGYRGGRKLKQYLLDLEKKHSL